MANSNVMRTNERAKLASSTLFNLAAALAGAIAVKEYTKPVIDLELIEWSFVTILLISVGWKWMSLLESEA